MRSPRAASTSRSCRFLTRRRPACSGETSPPTPLDLVVPAGHRLADRSRVALGELAGEAFIDFPSGYGNRVVTDRAFIAAGLRRHVTIEITAIGAGADFVRHGLGVALLPRGSVAPDAPRRTVEAADPDHLVHLCRTSQPSATSGSPKSLPQCLRGGPCVTALRRGPGSLPARR
ncbi:LysR substrate-binding domain-containing protein [Streptomyces sp. DSM 118878]